MKTIKFNIISVIVSMTKETITLLLLSCGNQNSIVNMVGLIFLNVENDVLVKLVVLV